MAHPSHCFKSADLTHPLNTDSYARHPFAAIDTQPWIPAPVNTWPDYLLCASWCGVTISGAALSGHSFIFKKPHFPCLNWHSLIHAYASLTPICVTQGTTLNRRRVIWVTLITATTGGCFAWSEWQRGRLHFGTSLKSILDSGRFDITRHFWSLSSCCSNRKADVMRKWIGGLLAVWMDSFCWHSTSMPDLGSILLCRDWLVLKKYQRSAVLLWLISVISILGLWFFPPP